MVKSIKKVLDENNKKEDTLMRNYYIEKYWGRGMSIWDISREDGVSHSTVHHEFVKLKIQRRTKKKALKLKWKKDGDKINKKKKL